MSDPLEHLHHPDLDTPVDVPGMSAESTAPASPVDAGIATHDPLDFLEEALLARQQQQVAAREQLQATKASLGSLVERACSTSTRSSSSALSTTFH